MTEMSNERGIAMILIMCAVVLVIVLLRRRMDLVVGFILRAVSGVVCIYVVNQIMLRVGFGGTLGWNPITVLTSGFLGIPGLIALYGIKIVSLL